MNINDLIKNLQQFGDEMEAPDGMNIVDETVEEENELAENKRKLRVYRKAYEALEELQDELDDYRYPATNELNKDTSLFYDRLTAMIEEIYSRSLAFEE